MAGGHLLAAFELNHSDGPWERPDNYQKANAVLRFSRGDTRNGFSITGTGYWADWDSTDQVPARAIADGRIARLASSIPAIAAIRIGRRWRPRCSEPSDRSSLRGNAYVARNRLNLFSNFTYFLDDPENGDQFEQAERRITTGGRLVYRRLARVFGRHTESAIGTQLRYDRLAPVGLYHTADRQRLSTTREDRVGQTLSRACTRRARSSGRAPFARRSACARTCIRST